MALKTDNRYRRIRSVDTDGHVFYEDWASQEIRANPSEFDKCLVQHVVIPETEQELDALDIKASRDSVIKAAYKAMKKREDICLPQDNWLDVLED